MKSLSRGSCSPFLDDSCFYIAPIDSHGNLVVKSMELDVSCCGRNTHSTVSSRVRLDFTLCTVQCFIFMENHKLATLPYHSNFWVSYFLKLSAKQDTLESMDFYDSNCHQVNWTRLFAKREPQIITNKIVEKNQVCCISHHQRIVIAKKISKRVWRP